MTACGASAGTVRPKIPQCDCCHNSCLQTNHSELWHETMQNTLVSWRNATSKNMFNSGSLCSICIACLPAWQAPSHATLPRFFQYIEEPTAMGKACLLSCYKFKTWTQDFIRTSSHSETCSELVRFLLLHSLLALDFDILSLFCMPSVWLASVQQYQGLLSQR